MRAERPEQGERDLVKVDDGRDGGDGRGRSAVRESGAEAEDEVGHGLVQDDTWTGTQGVQAKQKRRGERECQLTYSRACLAATEETGRGREGSHALVSAFRRHGAELLLKRRSEGG